MTKLSAKWTENDIKTLERLYGTLPNVVLAKELGRTKQAIQHRAHKLGITSPKLANYKYCVDCGVKLSRAACYNPRTERCVDCSNKNRSGSGHHNWKGGIAALRSLVHVLLKPVWIDPILKRDGYCCQFCGKHGGDLNVHHIYPYHKIRDEVVKANPNLSTRTFEGKKKIALLIVDAHKMAYGISLCEFCHAKIHREKRGELLGSPERDNQQPSRPKLTVIVGRKVHRLMGEDSVPISPTRAPRSSALRGEDIVGTCK